MANFQAKDAGGTTRDFKATGSGGSGDPFIPEKNVNVVSALPAGDNNIGNVDVLSLPSTTNAGATAKTLDYDSGAGSDTVTGFGILLPKSGGAVAGGTSSDPIRIDPTGTSTQPISAASLPLPTGAATAAKQPALGTAGSASADVITVQGIASMTALKVDGSAITQPVSDGGGSLTVDGTVTASLASSTNAGATAKTADYDTGAGTDTVTMFGFALPASGGAVAGGTSTNPLRIDPTGTTTQPVSGTVTANAGTGTFGANVAQLAGTTTDTNSGNKSAGTLRVVLATDQPQLTNKLLVTPDANSAVNLAQVGGNSVNTGTGNAGTGTARVVLASDQPVVATGGNVAHDGVDSGNPIKQGFKAINAEVTAVANADRVDGVADLTGKQIVLPYANPENFIAGKTSDITGTSDTAVIAAQGAGVRIYVTQIIVTNSHASVNTWVNIKDGATTIYTGYAYSAGGGFVINFPVPLRLTANTALNAACETTGSNVRVSASGYKGA